MPDEFKTHSPLMMALEKKQSDIAQKLVELGASVAFKNKVGNQLHNSDLKKYVFKKILAGWFDCSTHRLQPGNS